MKRCPNCTTWGPCHVIQILGYVALLAAATLAIVAVAGCHVKPILYTPEQRREWSPGYGATDYPPLSVGAPRDAGYE